MLPEAIVAAAEEFHAKADIAPPAVRGPVVEVAHQPLFMPFPGFFGKAAMGCWLAEKRGGTCVFGFVDDDFALFPGMWSTRLPARNKAGYRRVGADVKAERRAFFALPKPSRDEVGKLAEETGAGDALLQSWEAADSLSGMNAVFAAKACGMLGIAPLFFEYSKLPRDAMEKQARFFAERQAEFVSAFNASVRKRKIAGMKPMAADELPLWAVGKDGTKKALHVGETAAHYSFKAVGRNIAFADFLGSECYVSGKGAMSEYGAVGHDVSLALGCAEPETFVWLNTDEYREAAAADAALEGEVSALRLRLGAAKKREAAAVAEKDATGRKRAWEEKKAAERALQKKQNGLFALKSKAEQAQTEYAITDLFSFASPAQVKRNWFAALESAKPERNELFTEFRTATRHGGRV
ncbi:hypothetical protein COU36_04855 [Candidatus Micrarchaeota archaeon CG10_big_fil_rev_8_21_14_0_10_59_7]|nr:MAG: hypothetical protein COU36_04855 [Candidatus Micrarchaeota archaeon CG10_big_fil_rev_8_21_14_0_10_59_7]